MTSRTRGKKKTIGEVCEGGQYRAVMSAQETLERMTTIGRTDITTFHDDQGNILPTSEWTPEMGQQVSKIESVVKNVAAGDGHVDTVLKISIWDKMKALEQLAKHHDLITQRFDVNMTVDNSLIEAGRARVAAAAGLRRLSEAKLPKRDRQLLEGEVVNDNTLTDDAVDQLSDHSVQG